MIYLAVLAVAGNCENFNVENEKGHFGWVRGEKHAKPAMFCTANDLQAWKDFPKGLRVLLLDKDSNSSSEIRSKLEAMDYIGKDMNKCVKKVGILSSLVSIFIHFSLF